MKLVLTCEHAEPYVPKEFCGLFRANPKVLQTHEAFDPGARELFDSLKPLSDYHDFQKICRLIVETNRSIGSRSLFSRFSKELTYEQKQELLHSWYFPYRNRVEARIGNLLSVEDRVVHFSIHSFTPRLGGESRNCDIGLLYDPERKVEKKLCKWIKGKLRLVNPELKIRFNYPYRGAADGFTTHLRRVFDEGYSGIEIEINQKYVRNGRMDRNLKTSFYEVLKDLK